MVLPEKENLHYIENRRLITLLTKHSGRNIRNVIRWATYDFAHQSNGTFHF